MAEQVVECLVHGGKATAAPPVGPALGPLGVNIGQVVAEINRKTDAFKGMQVPVKITVKQDKSFTISIGTPPVSALLKKEAIVEKGASNPLTDKIADLKIEQIIKIAKMKSDSLLGRDMFAKVKEVIGSCDSMGILVEGKSARETIDDINKGFFADKIRTGKTELSADDLKRIEEQKKKLQEELAKRKAQYEAQAKQLIEQLVGQPRGTIKAKLVEMKIPSYIIEALLPVEGAATAGGGAAPVAPASEEKKK